MLLYCQKEEKGLHLLLQLLIRSVQLLVLRFVTVVEGYLLTEKSMDYVESSRKKKKDGWK